MQTLDTILDKYLDSRELKKEFRDVGKEWIKEDLKIGKKLGLFKNAKFGELELNPYGIMILRWMQRFNINEKDLNDINKMQEMQTGI